MIGSRIAGQIDEAVELAYRHGYKAGLKGAAIEIDRLSYRRGYLAGYNAARRGAESFPDGAPTGRERRRTVSA